MCSENKGADQIRGYRQSQILYEASIGRGTDGYINNLGRVIKMDAMPIYCKNPSKMSSQNR